MSLFKDIYDIVKDLFVAARESGNQVLADKAMDVQSKLFEFKEENENLKDKIKELNEQIQSLDNSAKFEQMLIPHKQPIYTLVDDIHDREYCAKCWDTKNEKAQLIICSSGRRICSNCGSEFYLK